MILYRPVGLRELELIAASERAGFVARFEIDDGFASRYPVHEVGGRACRELWVPADELAEFNRHLVGRIEVIESIYGEGFEGEIDAATKLPVVVAAMMRTK